MGEKSFQEYVRGALERSRGLTFSERLVITELAKWVDADYAAEEGIGETDRPCYQQLRKLYSMLKRTQLA